MSDAAYNLSPRVVGKDHYGIPLACGRGRFAMNVVYPNAETGLLGSLCESTFSFFNYASSSCVGIEPWGNSPAP